MFWLPGNWASLWRYWWALGSFGKALSNLLSHNPGFAPERLVSFSIDPRLSGYDFAAGNQIYRDILQRLQNLPAVQAAAVAEIGPLMHSRSMTNVSVEGFWSHNPEDYDSDINAVGAGYFRTLGTPLIAGREFTAADHADAPQVAIVNQAFAKHFLPAQNPIGKHFHRGSGGPFDIEIVSVVKDANTMNLREAQSPAYYMPLDQYFAKETRSRRVSFFLRSSANAATLERDIRATVRAIAPNLPVYDLKTMAERVNESIYTERLSALLAVLFGSLASILAAVGLFGVVAYSVARHTPEIGIRLALGALPAQVLRLVMRGASACGGWHSHRHPRRIGTHSPHERPTPTECPLAA